MPKQKLGRIEDEKAVKLIVELPAALHRDLIAYGQMLGRETGDIAVVPVKLIFPMLSRFIAADRAFAKARRQKVHPPPAARDPA